EFVVCLPGADGLRAASVAERMRRQIENMEIMLPDNSGSIRITASFGTASISVESGRNVDLLIKSADDALYRAKEKGRNRVWGDDK
ncbi:MAG: GGDEF domain-containing protein, partial [Candidatus Electryonea clarkiae]|nr:GGDEF domain-containing protein [Candidatus Electryonea clarkiae]